jgi:hypothetical protein
LYEGFPLVPNIVLVKNGIDGTLRTAGAAVDAILWVNVKHLVALMEGILRAHNNATSVFAAKTRGSDGVGHLDTFLQG